MQPALVPVARAPMAAVRPAAPQDSFETVSTRGEPARPVSGPTVSVAQLRAGNAALNRLLSPELQKKLGKLDLQQLCANDVELLRVLTRALPALSAIEEIRGDAPQRKANKDSAVRLYLANFSGDEAEAPEKIQERRQHMDRLGDRAFRKANPEEWKNIAERYGDSRFHHLALVDKAGHLVAQRQLSVVPVGDDGVSVYTQYTSVASAAQMKELYGVEGVNMREKGMLTLLHALSLAIAQADGRATARPNLAPTYFECEMKGQGKDAEAIDFTFTRLGVHNKVGAKVMMLEMPDGRLMTPHCQPALDEDAKPVLLHFMTRFPKYAGDDIDKVVRWETPEQKKMARDMVESFFANFEREDFAKEDVDYARKLIMRRFDEAARVVFLPPSQVPDVMTLASWDATLAEQVERDFGPAAAHLGTIRGTRAAARAIPAAPQADVKPLDAKTLESACALLERQFPGESPSLGLRASLDPSQDSKLVEARTAQGLRPPRDMQYFVTTDPKSGAVTGVCGDYRYADEKGASWVGWFAVAPEVRGQGLGGALLDQVIERARARGDAIVRLYTSDGDAEAAAQHLYESRGFRITGYGARDVSGEKLVYRELAV